MFRMMTIESTGPRRWSVMAEWLGAIRPVFTSEDIFECIRWRAANKEN
jgi:hypothetical protein